MSEPNIVDVISKVIPLSKSGMNYKGTCPFCNANCFVVSERKQIYTCFGCGLSGDIKTFVADKRLNKGEAL